MLRVTEEMTSRAYAADLTGHKRDLYRRQMEATSGTRIPHPSSDPAGAASVIRYNSELAHAEQSLRNVTAASAELAVADQALDSAWGVTTEARELALAMATGTVSSSERRAAAQQIQRIHQELVSLGNTRQGGVYIFGGHETGAPPFSTGGVFTGDTNIRQVEAGPGNRAEASASGAAAFTASGGTDIFSALSNLASAMSNNNLGGIRQHASTLGVAQEQISRERANAGLRGARLTALGVALETRTLNIKEGRAAVADADSIESISALARAQQALQQTVQVSSAFLNRLTLVDKL